MGIYPSNIARTLLLWRGLRQGCPLSPLLYVLFGETMTNMFDGDVRFVAVVLPGGKTSKMCSICIGTCIVSSLPPFNALSQNMTIFQKVTGGRVLKS